MGITAAGVGSGIPVQDIVDELVASTRLVPDETIMRNEISVSTQISANASLKSALETFEATLDAMNSIDTFVSFNCNVINNPASTNLNGPLFTASASDTSSIGTYQIEVDALAVAQQLGSVSFTDGPKSVIGTGTLIITANGQTFNVAIDATCNTLQDIATAINTSPSNIGVTANILNVDAGSQLILTSNNTGTDYQMTIDVIDDDGNNTDTSGLSVLAYDVTAGVTNMAQLQSAANAVIKINNQTVTSQSNVIENAINNTTIVINQVSLGNPATLNISLNTDALEGQIKNFINAYNQLVTTCNQLDFYNPTTKEKGTLWGDPLIRTIESQLEQNINAPSTATGAIQYFALIGIQINEDHSGTLILNDEITSTGSSRLDTILEKNPMSIVNFFIGEDIALNSAGLLESTGLLQTMINFVTPYTQIQGVIDTQDFYLNEQLVELDRQKVRLDERMDKLEKQLLKEFGAMDKAVAQMKQTSSFITQSLVNLPTFDS